MTYQCIKPYLKEISRRQHRRIEGLALENIILFHERQFIDVRLCIIRYEFKRRDLHAIQTPAFLLVVIESHNPLMLATANLDAEIMRRKRQITAAQLLAGRHICGNIAKGHLVEAIPAAAPAEGPLLSAHSGVGEAR